ncbi:MAG: alpha-amylase [Nitrospirae bacterium]|nr:alpha-amylase [Nitrospirota bacterium]
MQLLPLDKLGTQELSKGKIQFGVFLPWVSADSGYRLSVKVIHENDQFLQDIQPKEFDLSHSPDPDYSDYWSTQITVNTAGAPNPKSAWGQPGRYVYRYCLYRPHSNDYIDWIIDPYAREYGVGSLSAFTLGYENYKWSNNEKTYKTPALNELIVYELNIQEFRGTIDSAIDQLDYLVDLGINCIEVMPVSNVALVVDWGYMPVGYFGVDERFGKRKDFQRFIDEAHKRNIAVVIDSVYGHTDGNFPYKYLYDKLEYHENPFMGKTAKQLFGATTDFNRKITQDFFYTVNYHWLDCYHADGFRYDCVPEFYNGSMGSGYANLVYNTYRQVKGTKGVDYYQRFFNGGGQLNLIQCAEQLEAPKEILKETYSTCTWQNITFDNSNAVAAGGDLYPLGMQLGLFDYPESITANTDTLSKSAFQYIENHDHSRFCCNFGTISRDYNELFKEGDRSLWYKVQPYLIAILTAKGIPMLWQGQEFCENYYVVGDGLGRVRMMRPIRWEYFYDDYGKQTISLVRKLIKLRKTRQQFLNGDYFFYNQFEEYQKNGVLMFSRALGGRFSLVALNFSGNEPWVPFKFPKDGDYTEELHGLDNLKNVSSNALTYLKIPRYYGRIWSI